MRRIFIVLFMFLLFSPVKGQNRLLDNEHILSETRACLNSTYNFNFIAARKHFNEVKRFSPDHPAVDFLRAFIIYWENFPLTPGHKKEEIFLENIERSITKSEEWVSRDESELEAIFFDLFSRAFYVMYWADNGKPGKVFPHLNTLYSHAMDGFEMKEDFVEFYFSTGLYNYYIESYPEKHPAYKPVILLFRDGDKKLGLRQLEYCAKNSVFVRIEAIFFLSLLNLNYEKDLTKAREYAASLYKEFPNNTFYAGKYLEILLLDKKYFFAPFILEKMKKWKDPFSRMQYHLYSAYLLEKSEKKYSAAAESYRESITLSEKFGSFTGTYRAIAQMGLGRISQLQGKDQEARSFFRQAKKNTSYDYILDDR